MIELSRINVIKCQMPVQTVRDAFGHLDFTRKCTFRVFVLLCRQLLLS